MFAHMFLGTNLRTQEAEYRERQKERQSNERMVADGDVGVAY